MKLNVFYPNETKETRQYHHWDAGRSTEFCRGISSAFAQFHSTLMVSFPSAHQLSEQMYILYISLCWFCVDKCFRMGFGLVAMAASSPLRRMMSTSVDLCFEINLSDY